MKKNPFNALVVKPIYKMGKIYISGKISEMKESDALKIFDKAEIMLKMNGWDAINPMRLPHEHDKTWESYMKEDIIAMIGCDVICMLPNWKQSGGAIIEKELAEKLKMTIIFL